MTKVLVAVPTGETSRYATFYDYYNQLERLKELFICLLEANHRLKAEKNMMIQAAIDNECNSHLIS